MKMEVKRVMIVAVTIGLLFGGFAMAQDQEAEDEGLPQVVREMLQQLEQEGWTEEQIAEFRDAARNRDWEETEGAEPEVLAMALQLANQDREQLEAAENADLALELAVMARTMERSGFDQREIARASFEGTREVKRNLKRIREEVGTGDMTQMQSMMRDQIRDRLDKAMENRSRASDRAGKSKGAGAGVASGNMDKIPDPDSAGRPGRD